MAESFKGALSGRRRAGASRSGWGSAAVIVLVAFAVTVLFQLVRS